MLHPLAGIQKHPGGPGSLNDWRDIQVREVWVDDGFSGWRLIGSLKGRGSEAG